MRKNFFYLFLYASVKENLGGYSILRPQPPSQQILLIYAMSWCVCIYI